jgi:hypothetical protein
MPAADGSHCFINELNAPDGPSERVKVSIQKKKKKARAKKRLETKKRLPEAFCLKLREKESKQLRIQLSATGLKLKKIGALCGADIFASKHRLSLRAEDKTDIGIASEVLNIVIKTLQTTAQDPLPTRLQKLTANLEFLQHHIAKRIIKNIIEYVEDSIADKIRSEQKFGRGDRVTPPLYPSALTYAEDSARHLDGLVRVLDCKDLQSPLTSRAVALLGETPTAAFPLAVLSAYHRMATGASRLVIMSPAASQTQDITAAYPGGVGENQSYLFRPVFSWFDLIDTTIRQQDESLALPKPARVGIVKHLFTEAKLAICPLNKFAVRDFVDDKTTVLVLDGDATRELQILRFFDANATPPRNLIVTGNTKAEGFAQSGLARLAEWAVIPGTNIRPTVFTVGDQLPLPPIRRRKPPIGLIA